MGSVIYFSHGGGPLPILGDPSHTAMISFMEKLPEDYEKPNSVIVISAHWEEDIPNVIGSKNPSLYYDYFGFPQEAYELKYSAPGTPELVKRTKELFEKKGIKSKINYERGFDHGLFIPLMMMYPEADIPMTQISLIKGLDPKVHIELGKAISSLEKENIMIIGSGFSFHNMRAFNWSGKNEKDPRNDEFHDWLIDVCTEDYKKTEREEKLISWEEAPNARYCHPRAEHLMPLHVCCGIAEDKGEIIFDDYILGKRAIAIRW
jgi:aromatic ring-opening dioxygenase catalytic subunit (LigB family)